MLSTSMWTGLMFIGIATSAHATATKCQEAFKASRQAEQLALNMTVSEASLIVSDIATRFGFSASDIKVSECPSIDNAAADYQLGSDRILPGEYILFNPNWVRQVAGADRTELYAIFAHELGHLVNKHFLKTAMPRRDKEIEADKFAGCVVATIGGDWEVLERLLRRLRPEVANEYPSKEDAVQAARSGWNDCKSRAGDASQVPAGLSHGDYIGFVVHESQNSGKKTTVLPLPYSPRPATSSTWASPPPEILGLTMGMRIEDAERSLRDQGFVRTDLAEGRLELNFGVPEQRAVSQNYPRSYGFRRTREGNIDDSVGLAVTSPISGAVLYSISYSSLFPERSAPPQQIAFDALRRRYGEPNPDRSDCWTWYKGLRVQDLKKWSCIGFLEYFNMLNKDKVDVVLTSSVNIIDGRARSLNLNLRDAELEASVQGDFQKLVESIFPEARVLSSTTSDPIKF